MKLFTTASKKVLIIAFWIVVWQICSVLIGSSIILASPFEVLIRILELIKTTEFWFTVVNSFCKIIIGFLLGMSLGTLLAVLCYKFRLFYEWIDIPLSFIRSIPVASFIVILLLWVSTSFLSTVVGTLIVLPVAFENVFSGLNEIDKDMLEMSLVFRVPFKKRMTYLYFSTLLPALLTSASVGIGFCFKSGVAAEIIGICRNTVGEAIYMSKINLETADVLAWTVVVILLSNVAEKLIIGLISLAEKEVRR